ncbi:hypothetical protein KI387_013232, partial [Taxus chinensis]
GPSSRDIWDRRARTGRWLRCEKWDNQHKEPKSNWDKRARNTRTGRTSRKETSQPKSNWDKRARNTRTGRTGRNCPKRSKIKIGRLGQKDPKYAKKPKEPKANQKVPRVFGQMRDKEAHFRWIGGFCPKQHWDIRDEWTRSTRKTRQAREPLRNCHVSSRKSRRVKGQDLKRWPEPIEIGHV